MMKLTNDQALVAQQSLGHLLELNLPVNCSIEIAKISVALDKQVETFRKVRDSYIANYQIRLEDLDTDKVKFTSALKGKNDEETEQIRNKALMEFSDKINELINSEGDDIPGEIHLPDNVSVKPEYLKSIIGFIKL
jgi:hypothetical protein